MNDPSIYNRIEYLAVISSCSTHDEYDSLGKHLRVFHYLDSRACGGRIEPLGIDPRRAGSYSVASARVDGAHQYVFAREHSSSGMQYVDACRIWVIS